MYPPLPDFEPDRAPTPSARAIPATIQLQRTDGEAFTLAESTRQVLHRAIDDRWLQPHPPDIGTDAQRLLNILLEHLDGFDIEDETLLSLQPRTGRLVIDLASFFASEPDARARARRAHERLKIARLIIDVHFHKLVPDANRERLVRLTRSVPTMTAWAITQHEHHRTLLESFWRERAKHGHLWDRERPTISDAIRRYIVERDNGKCQAHDSYRSTCCSTECTMHIDHVIPISRGGTDHPDNLQLLCAHCNIIKSHQLLPRRKRTTNARSA
jgi:5-methylcytosine-specific restriction endonuclease McrA